MALPWAPQPPLSIAFRVGNKMTEIRPDFLAFAASGDAAVLGQFAGAHGWSTDCVYEGDIRTATEYLKTHRSPQLLLVEIPSAEESQALIDALADVCEAGTKVIVIGHVNEYSFYCWLTEIGISSYLLKPLALPALETAFQKSLQAKNVAAAPVQKKAKVIAVVGARGGVGASTMAINIAGLAAEIGGFEVALVDAEMQEGTIALSLDIEPTRGMRDVLEKPERIDDLFAQRVMTKLGTHLSVLCSEEPMSDRIPLHENAASTLLDALHAKFDVVVVDLPRYLSPFGRSVLEQTAHVVLVADLSLASLRDTLRIGDLLRDSAHITSLLPLANRVGYGKGQEVKKEDFEKGIGTTLAGCIPFAPEVFMHIGNDIPVVKHKNHAAAKALRAFAAQMLPELEEKTEAKKSFGLDFLKGKKE